MQPLKQVHSFAVSTVAKPGKIANPMDPLTHIPWPCINLRPIASIQRLEMALCGPAMASSRAIMVGIPGIGLMKVSTIITSGVSRLIPLIPTLLSYLRHTAHSKHIIPEVQSPQCIAVARTVHGNRYDLAYPRKRDC